MKNITYKEIAKDLGKSEGTIKQWKINHPVLLEYVKIGAFCKKNNITIEHIKKCVELQQLAKWGAKQMSNLCFYGIIKNQQRKCNVTKNC